MCRQWLIWTLNDLFLPKIREAHSLGLLLTEKYFKSALHCVFSFIIKMWNSIWPSLIETGGALKTKMSPWTSVGYMFWLSWFLTKPTYAKSSHVANLIWPQAINTKKVLLKLFQSTTRIYQLFHPPSPRNCYYEHYPACHSQMMLTFIPFFFHNCDWGRSWCFWIIGPSTKQMYLHRNSHKDLCNVSLS